MKADRSLRLAGLIALPTGVALAFAALFSHASRVFAVDDLAGTEHAELMIELSRPMPGERWLLTVGVMIVIVGVVLLAVSWFRRRTARRQHSVNTASR